MHIKTATGIEMSWDDFLFEKRNKQYGAYKLRKLYKLTVILSLLLSTFVMLVIVMVPFLINLRSQFSENFIINKNIIAAELMPIEETRTFEEEQKALPKKEASTEIPKVEEKEDVNKDTTNTLTNKTDSVQNIAESTTDSGGKDNASLGEAIFSCGRDLNIFRKWFVDNYKYPEKFKQKGEIGKILLQFCVNKFGAVDSVKIVSGIDPALDGEALRVMKTSPRWKPCYFNGHPVRQQYLFPIYIPK
jgi:protein TonB